MVRFINLNLIFIVYAIYLYQTLKILLISLLLIYLSYFMSSIYAIPISSGSLHNVLMTMWIIVVMTS